VSNLGCHTTDHLSIAPAAGSADVEAAEIKRALLNQSVTEQYRRICDSFFT
jgi:hypothetical protein